MENEIMIGIGPVYKNKNTYVSLMLTTCLQTTSFDSQNCCNHQPIH